MKITKVITEEEIKLITRILKPSLSFTELAIINEFLIKCTRNKAILLDDYKAFIEKEIDIVIGVAYKNS